MKIETLYGESKSSYSPFISIDNLSWYRRRFKEIGPLSLSLGNCPEGFSIKCVLDLNYTSQILLTRYFSRIDADPILKEGLRNLYSLKFSDPFKEVSPLLSLGDLHRYGDIGRIIHASHCPSPNMASDLLFYSGSSLSKYTQPGYAWPGNTLLLQRGSQITASSHAVESAKLYFSDIPGEMSSLQVGKHIPMFKDVGLGVSPQAFVMTYLGDTPLRIGTGNPERDLEVVCGTMAIIRYESFFELGIPIFLYDPEGNPLREIFLDIVRPSPRWEVFRSPLLSPMAPLSSDEREWNGVNVLLTEIGEFYSE